MIFKNKILKKNREFGKCFQISKMFVISKIVCESKKYSQIQKISAISENVCNFEKCRQWFGPINPRASDLEMHSPQDLRAGRIVRTSLYADGATVFMAPIKRDMDNLSVILRGLGEVMVLCTEFHKSSMVPIRLLAV